jgi:hypothetical protein
MSSGNYVATEEPNYKEEKGMILSYEKLHRLQCSNCGEYHGTCNCKNPSFFDVWTLKFDHFSIEMWNEANILESDCYVGSIPKTDIEPITTKLYSERLKRWYTVTIEFENGKYYLTENHDYSMVENQIGCGWCAFEKECPDRDPKINKAKMGCTKFKHYSKQN